MTNNSGLISGLGPHTRPPQSNGLVRLWQISSVVMSHSSLICHHHELVRDEARIYGNDMLSIFKASS